MRSFFPPKFAAQPTTTPATAPAVASGPAGPTYIRYDELAAELNAELSKKKKANAAVVFKLLDRLDQDEAAERGISDTYRTNYGITLSDALDQALSGLDRLHARRLLTESTHARSDRPMATYDFDEMSREIKSQLKGKLTHDKKYKVFDLLSQLRHDPELLADLRAAYRAATGAELDADLKAKFEKSDPKGFAYVTSLLTGAPTGERINVGNATEEAEAAKIIAQIKADYGIELDSQSGLEGEKIMTPDAPEELKKQVRTAAWEYNELVALQKALAFYAPILGAKRATSSRAAIPQEVLKVARLDASIDQRDMSLPENKDKSPYDFDNHTGGMAMASKSTFATYTALTTGTDSDLGKPFADNGEFIQANMVHELGHLLLGSEIDAFLKAVKYWKDPATPDLDAATKAPCDPKAEAPISNYGKVNASEDLAETAKNYFMRKDEMKAKFPIRYAFMERCVKNWGIQPKK